MLTNKQINSLLDLLETIQKVDIEVFNITMYVGLIKMLDSSFVYNSSPKSFRFQLNG